MGFHLGVSKPGREASLHPTPLDIAWAAGVFEGEGNCQHNNNSEYARVSQKDCWMLERVRDLFGGVVVPGVEIRELIQDSTNGESRARARGFLMTIYMFLSPRRKDQVRTGLRNK